MALKTILVALTTIRPHPETGKPRRVRFPAGSVVDLTSDELETFDRLQRKTGKLHYRKPLSEGGQARESAPEVPTTQDAKKAKAQIAADDGEDYAGESVEIADKTVTQLKAYLDFHNVDYPADAKKAVLLALAKSKAAQADDKDKSEGDDADADKGKGPGEDPDEGL
jgi:hypothetical protein